MWDNQPATCDLKSLITSLNSKNVDIKHYIGNFGFNWPDTYAYYLTPDRKLMRVKTTWEIDVYGGKIMKIHWDEASEF